MARRGILAEMQHQARVAAREAERRQRAAIRDHQAAVRRAEQARLAEERATAAASRSAAAERKRLEREAKAAHVAAMEARVAASNAELAAIYEEIDGLLAATLGVDDYVDLETLRQTVEHPAFDRPDLEIPLSPPEPIEEPAQPVLRAVNEPRFPWGKKKHAAAVAAAEVELAAAQAQWRQVLDALPAQRAAAEREHAAREAERVESLAKERARYAEECAAREADVVEHNAMIDTFLANLAYGAVDAVEEYVGIVLANSLYPPEFPVRHEATFEPEAANLRLRALVPGPDRVPSVKAHKYAKAADEITTTNLSQKEARDRYSNAVQQAALRSLHEVFEADRRGVIKTISLEVGTQTTDPATGRETYVPFVAVAAERDTFLQFDLAAVVPAATLEHLGAAVSKNPHGLVAVDPGGVRRS